MYMTLNGLNCQLR